jgi:hypothetical protein
MAELNTDVHIFLSSTFIDLKELREKISAHELPSIEEPVQPSIVCTNGGTCIDRSIRSGES